MADLGNIASFAYSVPEIALALSVVGLFIVDLVVVNKEIVGRLALFAMGLVVALLAFSLPEAGDIHSLFNRQVVFDEYGQFFKLLLALCGFAAVWMSLGSEEVRRVNQGEYFAILLAATLGMLFMASATNLLMGYLALGAVRSEWREELKGMAERIKGKILAGLKAAKERGATDRASARAYRAPALKYLYTSTK